VKTSTDNPVALSDEIGFTVIVPEARSPKEGQLHGCSSLFHLEAVCSRYPPAHRRGPSPAALTSPSSTTASYSRCESKSRDGHWSSTYGFPHGNNFSS
jgi:hypothetical protein